MTDTYTIEAIESAKKRAAKRQEQDPQGWDAFIAELTKPKEPAWTPKVGGAYAYRWQKFHSWNIGQYKWDSSRKAEKGCEYRPLTAAEIGLEPFKYLWSDGDKNGGRGMLEVQAYNDACDDHNETLFPQEGE